MPAPVRSRHRFVPVLLSLVTGLSALLVVAAPPSSAEEAWDYLADAAAVGLAVGASTQLLLDTSEGTLEADEPRPCGTISNTVWVAYTPIDDTGVPNEVQLLTAETHSANTQMDTVLAVYTDDDGAFPLDQTAGCNDDTSGIGSLSRLTFPAVEGTTYYLQVGHYGGTPSSGDPGPGPLELRLTAAPAEPNDDASTPIEITGAGGSTSVDTTNATPASTDPPEPTTTGRTLWYSWTAPGGIGYETFTAGGSSSTSPDTFLYAFPETGPTTMATAIAYNDDSDEDEEDYRAEIGFPVTAGTTYRLLVGTRGGHGVFDLSWSSLPSVPTRPSNDRFADATVLTGASGSIAGNHQDATAEPQDPELQGTSGGFSVWYRWQATQDGIHEFRTASATSGFDSFLAVLQGPALESLQTVVAEDAGATEGPSEVRFEAVAGTTYWVLVDGWPSRTRGPFTLSWERLVPVATTTVLSASSPAPGLVDVTVTVTRSGGGPAGDGTVTIADGEEVIAGLAYLGGSVTRRFRNQAGGSHTYVAGFVPDDPLELASESTPVTVAVVGRAAPANDDFTDATVISGAAGTSGPVDLLGASREEGEPDLDPDVDGASVWYRWTAPVSDAFTFTVTGTGAGVDTVVGALRGTSLDDLVVLRSSRDPGGPGSEITFSAIEGRTYHVLVDAVVPGTASLAWSRAGGTATTTALTATGDGAYAYTLEATVTGAEDGRVVFLRDGAVVGIVDTTDGEAALARTFQRPGASSFVAEFYPDDPAVRPSASAAQALTITAPPAPPNDLFVNARSIAGASSAAPVPGTTLGATADPGTPPSRLSSNADTTVWYRWVAPSSGSFRFTATRTQAGVDTVLRAFEGTTLTALRPLAENDDGTGVVNSVVGISAVAGRTYHLAVDAYRFSDDMGPFELTWTDFAPTGATTTALTAARTGRTVTLTATVDDPAATASPAGAVEFLDGTASLGVVAVSGTGTAARTLTGVAPGNHSYTARFVPLDANLAQSTSPPRLVAVPKSASRTALAAPARVRPGARPTVTATVKVGTANGTGSVRFAVNGRAVRTVALRGGRASAQLPALAAGTARVVATYLGNTATATSTAGRSIAVRR